MATVNLQSSVENGVIWIAINETEASIRISSSLSKAFADFLIQEPKGLAVDMSQIDFVDSSFLGTLIATLKEAESKGIKFVLFGLRAPVQAIFELTRLDKIMEILPDRETAQKFFQG